MTRYCHEPTARGDQVASEMRDHYEANRPLRWWQKRKAPDSWGCISDDLMLGLRNVVLEAERVFLTEREARDDSSSKTTQILPSGKT